MILRPLCGAAIAAAALYALTPPPTVHLTWPDAKCVRVVPADAGTCDALPRRYEVTWVSPPAPPERGPTPMRVELHRAPDEPIYVEPDQITQVGRSYEAGRATRIDYVGGTHVDVVEDLDTVRSALQAVPSRLVGRSAGRSRAKAN